MSNLVVFTFALAMARELTFSRDVTINGEISVAQVDTYNIYQKRLKTRSFRMVI